MHIPALSSPFSFLSSDGPMASLIRQFDWEKTPLGGPVGWPAPLKTLIATVLRANVPIILLWGPDGVMIYNDAYAIFAGGRHPALLGCNVREGWPEVADFNDNVLKVVLAGGTLAYRDQHLVLERKGIPEDVWLNLDYSPILDETGAPGGVLSIVKETTERVRVEQRLRIAQEAGGIGTFEWYPETGRLDVSDEYRRIWGLGPDILVTDKLLVGLLHPDDRAVAGPAKLAEANPLEYAEYRRIDPQTGAVRWIARRGEKAASAGLSASPSISRRANWRKRPSRKAKPAGGGCSNRCRRVSSSGKSCAMRMASSMISSSLSLIPPSRIRPA
jgi:PAS domain-containing protein